jgi:hypothetical protein
LWVALICFATPTTIWEVDGFRRLGLLVSPLGVVAWELLVREGGEAIDVMGSSDFVVVAEEVGCKLSVGVVGSPTQAVFQNDSDVSNVYVLDGDVVFVGEEEKRSELRHHGR